jgi:hypothetical protein
MVESEKSYHTGPSAKKKKLAEGQFFCFKQIGIFRKKGYSFEKFSY